MIGKYTSLNGYLQLYRSLYLLQVVYCRYFVMILYCCIMQWYIRSLGALLVVLGCVYLAVFARVSY